MMQRDIDFWIPQGSNVIIVRQFALTPPVRREHARFWRRWQRKQQPQPMRPRRQQNARWWGNDGPEGGAA